MEMLKWFRTAMTFIGLCTILFVPVYAEAWIEVYSDDFNSLSDTWQAEGTLAEVKSVDEQLELCSNATLSAVTAQILTPDYIGSGEYSVEFKAKINSWTCGPKAVYGGSTDSNSLGVKLLPESNGRLMFTIEEDKVITSTSAGTWANYISYPEDFDPAAWHVWRLVKKSDDTVDVYADSVKLGTGYMQVPQNDMGNGELQLFVTGNATDKGSVLIEYVKVYSGNTQTFCDEFSALDGNVWTAASTAGKSSVTITNVISALHMESVNGNNGALTTVDVSAYDKAAIEFTARVNSYTTGPGSPDLNSLAIQLFEASNQRMSISLEEKGVVCTDSALWGQTLTYPTEVNIYDWNTIRIETDNTTDVSSYKLYINGTELGEGTWQDMGKENSETIIKLFAKGNTAYPANADVDSIKAEYYTDRSLPEWESGASMTVENTADGFTVSFPAAKDAQEYVITINENSITTAETSYTFTGLERLLGATEAYDISVSAKNEIGTSETALSGSGNPIFDPDSGEMDIKKIIKGTADGGSGKYGYYRIPGIVVTKEDTVITYWEARTELSDWADMDILAIRSTDGGETFGDPIILAHGADSGKTVNNPIMIVGNDNTIHFLHCVQYGICTECNDSATSECPHGSGVFYRKSTDDGKTWSDPVNITDYTNPDLHNVVATGPGHGICIKNGTLIATVWYVPKSAGSALDSHHPGEVATLYSTDNGETWHMGETVPNTDGQVADPNETVPVETSDGRVMLNIRSHLGGYRALAWSNTGYSDWTEMQYDKTLIDPTCMGSVTKYDPDAIPGSDEDYTLLLVNCEDPAYRYNITVKGSLDDGKHWSVRKVIDPGKCGYSDIAVDSKGTIYVLYEFGGHGASNCLARFNYACLTEDSKAKLKVLDVKGEDAELVYVDEANYTLRAHYNSELDFEIVPLFDETEITVNGSKYTVGDDLRLTFDKNNPSIVIKTVNGEAREEYTIKIFPYAPEDALVMHLDGSDLADKSPYGNDPVIFENSTISVMEENTRDESGSYSVSGESNATMSIDVDTSNGMNVGEGDFTVSVWINPDTVSGRKFLYWYGGTTPGTAQYWLRSDDTNIQANFASDGSETILTASDVLAAGEWCHVTVVRSGMNYYIYVNGEQKASASTSYVRDLREATNDKLVIMAEKSTSGRDFDGLFDEFMFFNYALTSEEIGKLADDTPYKSGRCRITSFSINGTEAVINGSDITLELPEGTDITSLSPKLALSEGASVVPSVGTVTDFSSPVVYTVTAEDGTTAQYTANITVSNVKHEIEIIVPLSRESGNSFYVDPDTGYSSAAKIDLTTENGEVIASFTESADNISEISGITCINLSTELSAGTYTLRITKPGYLTHTGTLTVTADGVSSESIRLTPGDVKSSFEDETGDGVIDIDDFIRVLRGFSSNADKSLRQVVDINEDGVVNVGDIAIVKANFGKTADSGK